VRDNFRLARIPPIIGGRRDDHFLKADLNEAALRRTLRVRRAEQGCLLVEISCRVIGGPYDPTSQNDARRTRAS
jgi:hypothetical protein